MRDIILLILAGSIMISGLVVASSFYQQRQLTKLLPLSSTKNQLVLIKQALIPLTMSFMFVLFVNSSFLLPQENSDDNVRVAFTDDVLKSEADDVEAFDFDMMIETLDEVEFELLSDVVDYGYVMLKDDDRLYRLFEFDGQQYLIDENFTTIIKIRKSQ